MLPKNIKRRKKQGTLLIEPKEIPPTTDKFLIRTHLGADNLKSSSSKRQGNCQNEIDVIQKDTKRTACHDQQQANMKGQANRSKSDLTSLLVILFGPLILSLVLTALLPIISCQESQVTPAHFKSLVDESSQISNLTHVSLNPLGDLKIHNVTLNEETSSSNNQTSASSLKPTGELSTVEVEPDDDDISDSFDHSGDANKIGAVLLDAASDGADLLVDRLRSSPEDGDDLEGNNNLSAAFGDSTDTIKTNDESVKPGDVSKSSSPGGPIKSRDNDLIDKDSQLKSALETYNKWKSTGDDIIELFSRKMLPLIIEHGYDVDGETVSGILQVFNGVRGLKPWAMKILDASAKISPGILVGTQSDFGDYDECLNVRVDDPNNLLSENPDLPNEINEDTGLRSGTLVGRYCLADVEFPKPPRITMNNRSSSDKWMINNNLEPIELRKPLLNFSDTPEFKDTIFVETGNFFHMLYVDPIRVGICMTNKINPDSFAAVLNKILQDFKVTIKFHGRCVTKYDKTTWTIYQKVSAYIILVACSLVLLCTFLDILHSKLNKLPLPKGFVQGKLSLQSSLYKYRPIFTSFSIIRNTTRLFKYQQSPNQRKFLQHEQYVNSVKLTTPSLSMINDSASGTESSIESSPSIERRSVDGSAMNLISSDSSSSSIITNSYSSSKDLPIKGIQAENYDDRQKNNLLCLHGIRVITMVWMIVNHTYLFGGFFVLWAHRRLIDIAEWPKSLSFQLVLNGWLTVETYFFLGAMIIVLNVMPMMKKRRFTYFSYVLHRLLRLLPAYVGLVSLNFLWPLISSGPVWLVKGKSFIQTPCENYLWTNFLFINNWIWPENQCMVHTWFLSADFQLYLMAPLIVYLLYRRPVLGHWTNLIVAIIASIFSGFVIYANKLMPSTLINKLEFDSIKQQLSYSYFATYQHMGPYCLGILTGYMLHKRPQVRLPKHLTWSLWILLPPLSFTTLLLTYLWNGAYNDPSMINPSPLVSALYVAIHRTIWTALVAWVVFACVTGRAKTMASFLSHQMFIPLSRLSFSIYLVHLPVIMFRALNLRHTIEWTDSNILWEACGNFIVSILIGYFINIAFESPIINLERHLRGSGSEEKKFDLTNRKYERNLRNVALGSNDTKQNQSRIVVSQEKNSSSSTDSTNESSSSESQSDSSPEQPRKVSNSSTNTDGTNSNFLNKNDRSQIKNDNYNNQGNQRRMLRPKHNSVERIFGRLDQQNSNPVGYSIYPDDLDDREPRATDFQDEAFNGPSFAGGYIDQFGHRRVDSLAMGDRYVKDDRSQWTINSRPTQYATMSRVPNRTNLSNNFDIYSLSHPLESVDNRPISHLGINPTERRFNGPPQRQYGSLQRRQGRYSTINNLVTADWRRSYHFNQNDNSIHKEDISTRGTYSDYEWPRYNQTDVDHHVVSQQVAVPRSEGSNITNWLSQGTMIPRVDSATLRRTTVRTEPSDSIVEENEDSAL